MASVKVPAFPKGVARGVWANKLSRSAIYVVESDPFNFDTGAAVRLFSVPDNSVVLGLGLEVNTAFDGESPLVTVLDSDGVIASWQDTQALTDTTQIMWVDSVRRYFPSAGAGNQANFLNVTTVTDAGATTGIGRIWIKIKPDNSRLGKKSVT